MRRLTDLNHLHHVNQVPFAMIMQGVGMRPVLMDFLMPGIDMVIWRMRPCVREVVDMEFRQGTLRTLDLAIEVNELPGAAIYEFDGFSFFAFRSDIRDQVLAEMGITEILSGERRVTP